MTRFHPRPIHALRKQIVAIFATYLRHVLVTGARFQLQHTRYRLPGGRLAFRYIFDGQTETGQTQRLIALPDVDVRLGRVVRLNVATAEQLRRPIIEIRAKRESVAAQFAGFVN